MIENVPMNYSPDLDRIIILKAMIKELIEQLKTHEGEEYWTVGDTDAIEKAEKVLG